MKKPIAILVGSAMLAVGGAAAALAAPEAPPSDISAGIVLTADHGTTRPNALKDVLTDLVADGTITQAQADAVTGALETRHEELKAAREAARAQMQAFLEDGVITADELAQLPEDHPLRSLGSILDDGQITLDELRSLRGAGIGGRGHHGPGGGHFRAPADDDGATTTPDVSAS